MEVTESRTDAVSARHLIRHPTFEFFYRTERDRLVRALTLTIGDLTLATEAVDEAMARAYPRWRHVGGYANPAGWVYRVALNWARSRLRKLARERHRTPPESVVWDPEPLDPTLLCHVRALPEHHRTVVVLRYFLDWSLDQIADALDIRSGTVKSRLHRALRELRSRLEADR